jgi:Flp pilus assembly protein TadD
MKALLTSLVAAALAGCASVPIADVPRALFADEHFGAPMPTLTPAEIFALNDDMRAFADNQLKWEVARNGSYLGLFDTLQKELRLDYDAAGTRTAEETFAARSGNCLSLVLLTAAFAKHLGVDVRYQSVIGEENWSRTAGIAFYSGHVNLKVGKRDSGTAVTRGYDGMTIDFVAPGTAMRFPTRQVEESTLLAMYMNNRAAEALVNGEFAAAYWWARAAIEQAPANLAGINTLGVIYLRTRNIREAEAAFRYVLEREPAESLAMTNLVRVLTLEGRINEAAYWRAKMAEIEPYPPFYFLDQGKAALERGEIDAALALFEKELKRLPFNDELHFAIAMADLRLGNLREAEQHLKMAQQYSPTPAQREIYGAKRAQLKGTVTN